MSIETNWPYPRWVAHRGAGKLAPENTLAAFRLGAAHEGPPHHAHGGVLALVLDQALGEAAAVFGGPGMTGRLTLHFRRATPLGDCTTEAWIDHSDGGKTVAKGRLYDAAGNLCVEADGLFIFPKWAADHPQWARYSDDARSGVRRR